MCPAVPGVGWGVRRGGEKLRHHSRLSQVQPVTHLEKLPSFPVFSLPHFRSGPWPGEALAGSASSGAETPPPHPHPRLPRLSPYLCCWALGSKRGNRPRKNMCLGSEPPSAARQAPREPVICIFQFSCLQQERMEGEMKYPGVAQCPSSLSASSRAAGRPLTSLPIWFCTIFCPWFPAQAIQVCPDTPGEWPWLTELNVP